MNIMGKKFNLMLSFFVDSSEKAVAEHETTRNKGTEGLKDEQLVKIKSLRPLLAYWVLHMDIKDEAKRYTEFLENIPEVKKQGLNELEFRKRG